MPRVSAAFFAMTTIYLLIGMMWGQYMGASEDHTLYPAHAHLNLAGGVVSAIYGTFYALTAQTYSVRLAWINFVLASAGVVLMIGSLTLFLSHGNDPAYLPTMITGEVLTTGSMLLFGFSVLRELLRARA
ncbi:MAG TPA: hypothetical protein VHL34_08880 [Rhizomicrobium sp.]|jgi:hypothetical protein|nr:hypothetical protein [Rhizomicrobium sp.]